MRRPCLQAWWLCLLLALPAAYAGIQIITDHPSPFAAADPNDPKYIVALYDSESSAAAVWPHGTTERTTTITRPGGQQLTCRVPIKPHHQQALAPLTATGTPSVVSLPGGTVEVPAKTPFELLELLTGRCLYHNDGQWTYEMCYKRSVRQFRQEAHGEGIEEFTCGRYKGDEQQEEAVLEDASASGYQVRYVRHTFDSGAKCLLTGQPRTAEVRFTCRADAKDDMVMSVKEFPTCNYVVMVSALNLCNHAAFKPRPADERLIACYPSVGSPPPAPALPAPSTHSTTAAVAAAAAAAGSKGGDGATLGEQLPNAAGKGPSGGEGTGSSQQPQDHIAASLAAEVHLRRATGQQRTSSSEPQQQQQQQQTPQPAGGTPPPAAAAAAAGSDPAAGVRDTLTQQALAAVRSMQSGGAEPAGGASGAAASAASAATPQEEGASKGQGAPPPPAVAAGQQQPRDEL